MKKVVLIDNYDSFTFNLAHLIQEITGNQVAIFKNDAFGFSDIEPFDYIILSPGPGIPDEAGKLKEVILQFYLTKKILGVCLGLQAVGEVFGAALKNLPIVYHGMKSGIHRTKISDPIFEGISETFEAGRYHSWVIDSATIPEDLLVTAVDGQNEIMAIRHRDYPLFGVQFHPESVAQFNRNIQVAFKAVFVYSH